MSEINNGSNKTRERERRRLEPTLIGIIHCADELFTETDNQKGNRETTRRIFRNGEYLMGNGEELQLRYSMNGQVYTITVQRGPQNTDAQNNTYTRDGNKNH